MKYYLTWLPISLLVTDFGGGIWSLTTLIACGLLFFFCRNKVNTCDSAYRCACTCTHTHMASPCTTNKITCPQSIWQLFPLSHLNPTELPNRADGVENKEVPKVAHSRTGQLRASPREAQACGQLHSCPRAPASPQRRGTDGQPPLPQTLRFPSSATEFKGASFPC